MGGESAPPRALRIGFLGNYGNGNLGDSATLEAVLGHFRQAYPQAHLVCFSPNPAGAVEEHGLPAFPTHARRGAAFPGGGKEDPPGGPVWWRNARFLASTYRRLRGLDYLIFPGGGQFDESFDGPWGYPFTLFKFAFLARRAGCRLLILSVGCEVIRTRLGAWFSRACFHRADLLSFRDRASLDLAGRMGYRGRARVFPDLAFSLEGRNGVWPAPARPPKGWIGVNPYPYRDPRHLPDGDAAAHAAFVASLAQSLAALATEGYGLLFLPSQRRMDAQVVEDLKRAVRAACPSLPAERIPDAPAAGLDALWAGIGLADCLIAMRFHGIVLGAMRGKPVLAIAYQRKMSDLMEDLGLGGHVLDPRELGPASLEGRLARLMESSAEVTRGLRSRCAANRQALDGLWAEAAQELGREPAAAERPARVVTMDVSEAKERL